MTRHQQRIKKRNKEIWELSKTMALEDIAIKHNLSVTSIYRILKHEN
ncbi:MAG: hypothetical protein AABY22_30640 [Nanoarchaeota archaeon]